MDYVDCGHTKTIHYHAAADKCTLLSGDNFPLGFAEDEQYRQQSVPLEADDILVFYSDGLVESPNPNGELFGQQRIMDFVCENKDQDARTLCKRLYEKLISHSMTVSFRDDMTYLVVKISSSAAVPLLSSEKLMVKSTLDSLKTIRDFIRDASEEFMQLDANFLTQLQIAVNETATNVIGHGYLKQPDRDIEIQYDIYRDKVIVQVRYWGRGFSNEPVSSPAVDGTQERGFGLFMSRQCVDEMTYSYDKDGSKVIRLIKFVRNE